jgi:GNAT superfamily N-acetyltransferase
LFQRISGTRKGLLMILRQALTTDVSGMQRVRLAVRENRLSRTTHITEHDYVAAITELGRGWVIEVAGNIVAFAVGYKTDGNIWALFVDPEHEGKGYGKRLHSVLIDWLWTQGLDHLWLTTAPNTRAEGFYVKQGWQNQGLTQKGEIRFELCRPDKR